jgi:tetratricopeptide (TPR) repeat protein
MRQFALLFFLVTGVIAIPAIADQNNPELDGLFARLHETADVVEAAEITKQIWTNWYQSNDAEVTQLMQLGEVSMRRAKYDEAVAYFSEIINIAPEFAEGWNRRATAYYLIGEYSLSTDDVDKTLTLEPRHFGALSGQGMIYLQLQQRELALQFMERALKVNPHLQSVRSSVKALKQLISEEII